MVTPAIDVTGCIVVLAPQPNKLDKRVPFTVTFIRWIHNITPDNLAKLILFLLADEYKMSLRGKRELVLIAKKENDPLEMGNVLKPSEASQVI